MTPQLSHNFQANQVADGADDIAIAIFRARSIFWAFVVPRWYSFNNSRLEWPTLFYSIKIIFEKIQERCDTNVELQWEKS